MYFDLVGKSTGVSTENTDQPWKW